MSGRDLCYRLEDEGLVVRLKRGQILVSPKEKLTTELREAIVQARQELLDYLIWREAAREVEASLPTPFRGSPERPHPVGTRVAPLRPVLDRSRPSPRLGTALCPSLSPQGEKREERERESKERDTPPRTRPLFYHALIRDGCTPKAKWEKIAEGKDLHSLWEVLLRHPSPYRTTERKVMRV
jgi:hypothetical protein